MKGRRLRVRQAGRTAVHWRTAGSSPIAVRLRVAAGDEGVLRVAVHPTGGAAMKPRRLRAVRTDGTGALRAARRLPER